MKLSDDDRDHLTGVKYSNAWPFPVVGRRRADYRIERLVDLARGRRVLHVGCCDHLPQIEEKLRLGLHLHQRLCQVAAACTGVDTNAEGVATLRRLGFPDVFEPQDLPASSYDTCLLADVIEHVPNPVDFLRSMAQYRFDELIVVTPNVFRWRNVMPGPELINSDHRYWFSPYTLCKVLVDAGYSPVEVETCHGDVQGWRGALASRLADLSPRRRDVLMVRATR